MMGLLTALAAGLASATMFASIASGALMSLVLFYLAPLPLMVAALGFGSITALVGSIIAALGLGVVFGFPYMAAFALTVALPAWWLGHLALLARPVYADPQSPQPAATTPALDWYPVGRILVWIAVFASLTTIGALMTLGTDGATITAGLRRGLMRIMGARPDGMTSGDLERVADALAVIAPAAATVIAMMTLTFNLWLAARVTVASGRLNRPWPDLRATTLPRTVLFALIAVLVLCFTGGLVALAAQITSAALLMAYGMTGFAVLHTLTQAYSGRAFVLGATYAATLFVGWPLIGMVGLGLADAVFGIRQTYRMRRGPPAAPPA
jgi:hypothetical protein